jgi:sodium/proline symporter
VILWKQIDTWGLYEIIPGFLLASIAIVLVSKLGSPSKAMVQRFETADAAYHADK